jgi:hypothetical protein
MAVILVVAPCSQVEVYGRFRDAFCLHNHLITLMMQAASISETSVNFYQTALCDNTENSHLHTRCRENFRSHVTCCAGQSSYLAQRAYDAKALGNENSCAEKDVPFLAISRKS